MDIWTAIKIAEQVPSLLARLEALEEAVLPLFGGGAANTMKDVIQGTQKVEETAAVVQQVAAPVVQAVAQQVAQPVTAAQKIAAIAAAQKGSN